MEALSQMKREYNTIMDDADSVNRKNFVISQSFTWCSSGNVSQGDQYLKVLLNGTETNFRRALISNNCHLYSRENCGPGRGGSRKFRKRWQSLPPPPPPPLECKLHFSGDGAYSIRGAKWSNVNVSEDRNTEHFIKRFARRLERLWSYKNVLKKGGGARPPRPLP